MYKLREIERKDLSIINKWRNDSELISMLGAPFRYINYEVDEKWYENYMANRNLCVRCAIVDNVCDDILGLVNLTNIDFINQSAVFSIMIGDNENQGKGIGTIATILMLKHAFLNLNLQRVELTTLESNKRAQRLYEKVGFVKEGIKRNSNYKNGIFVNMISYSILKDEFLNKYTNK